MEEIVQILITEGGNYTASEIATLYHTVANELTDEEKERIPETLVYGGTISVASGNLPAASKFTIYTIQDENTIDGVHLRPGDELVSLTNTSFGTSMSGWLHRVQGTFTSAEKAKLASLDEYFKGKHLTLAALQTAHPTGKAGDYADVDAGSGTDAERYIWDTDDGWVKAVGTSPGETNASIKTKYEANADTNAFTDAEKDKVSYIQLETSNAADKILQVNNTSPEDAVILKKDGQLRGFSSLKYTSNGLEILGPVALVDNTGTIYGQLRRIGTDTELRAEGSGNLLLNAPLGEVQVNAASVSLNAPTVITGGSNILRLKKAASGLTSIPFEAAGTTYGYLFGNYSGSSSNWMAFGKGGATTSIYVQHSGNGGIGTDQDLGAKWYVKGGGSDGNTIALCVKNFSNVDIIKSYNDGVTQFGNFTRGGGINNTNSAIITNMPIWAGGGLNLNAPTVGHNPFDGLKKYGSRIEIWGGGAKTISFGGRGNSLEDVIQFHGGFNPNNSSTSKNFLNVNPILNGAATYSGNFYLIRIDPFTNTNNGTGLVYGIYQDSSSILNYFGGKVGFGTADPTSQLHVDGTVRFENLPTASGANIGDLYADTAANIAANGDKIVGIKV